MRDKGSPFVDLRSNRMKKESTLDNRSTFSHYLKSIRKSLEQVNAPYAKETEIVCKPQDSLEKLRRAQGLVGELLWVATRTRPDLVYGVSRIGQLLTRDVHQAIQRAEDMTSVLEKYEASGGLLWKPWCRIWSWKSASG